MEENIRIPDNVITSDFADGDILTNLDINKIIEVFKVAINANFADIKLTGNDIIEILDKLKDGVFSKASENTLQNNDTMFPSSRQVKNYVDSTVPTQVTNVLSSISGYDATATQILKNNNGTLTWVTEE